MTKSNLDPSDLAAMARQVMIDAGFVPDLPSSFIDEIHVIQASGQTTLKDSAVRDLRSLSWSSIDDQKSRDLDQVEYTELLPDGDIRLMVGIADVDALVHQDSPVDIHAEQNATSVYTGIKTFPMLPEELSTDLTSLVGGADRLSVVIEMLIGHDGTTKDFQVSRATIHNYAKLSYEQVGAWLDQSGPVPPEVIRRSN